MSIAISKKDIPLKLTNEGFNVDAERLNIELSRATTIPRNITLPIVESAIADARFPVEDPRQVDETVTDLVRLIKTYMRPVIVRYGLDESGIVIINPRDYYNRDDIISSYTFTAFLHSNKPGTAFIDVTGVTRSLLEHGLLKEDERATFGDQISSFVVNHKNWAYANLTNDRYEFEERVRDIAEIFIEEFIYARWYVNYLNEISDQVSEQYFNVDKEYQIGIVAREKLPALLVALGYMTIDEVNNEEDLPFEEILENLTRFIQTKVLDGHQDEEPDELLISEMSRTVNLNFLNALFINSLDGNVKPDNFDYSLATNITYSQAEVEQAFFDASISIIRPDSIRQALHQVSGLPLSGLQDKADDLHETLVDIFKSILNNHYKEPHVIFTKILSAVAFELKSYVDDLEIAE